LARGVVQRVAEDFNLLHERQAVIVGRHLQHNAVLDIEENLSTIPILADKHVQSVAVRDKAKQTGLRTKRDRGIALDVKMSLS
jgi:hypothetical protein